MIASFFILNLNHSRELERVFHLNKLKPECFKIVIKTCLLQIRYSNEHHNRHFITNQIHVYIKTFYKNITYVYKNIFFRYQVKLIEQKKK